MNLEYSKIRDILKKGSLLKYLKCNDSDDIIRPFISIKNKNNNTTNSDNVPLIIHFIWIGSIIPEKYINNIKTYVKNNPNYKIFLWLDHLDKIELLIKEDNIIIKNVNTDISLINKNEYNLINNYGFKADILRYEIIYNFGGIYSDVDSISVKPFDNNFKKDTVSYITPAWNNLQNAFLCFSKNNNFLKYCIECLPYSVKLKLPWHLTVGPTFLTTCFYFYNDSNINLIHQNKIIWKSNDCYTYHTNDANWVKQSLEKVSVIIASYNRFKYLLNAIKSVKNQTYKNIEIIVVNDCSTEPEYYSYNFEDIKIIHLEENSKKKLGFVSCGYVRNFGIKESTGDYIAILDDDDIWFPKKLELQIQAMKENNCELSCTEGLIGQGMFDTSKKYKKYITETYMRNLEIKFKHFKSNALDNGIPEIWGQKIQKIHNLCICSSVVFKKNIIKKVGLFPEVVNGHEDKQMWIKILEFTNCKFIKEVCVYYDSSTVRETY